ncbi:MAG: hypothetical protein CBARDCOR_4035 [uncultured Caballeronia sp.]|nr:MAG: hypothetical protein CBARDCOR_4035 [uncultured Caballeronia sp.]
MSLRGRIGSTTAKLPVSPSRDRLRGAFRTNPESWGAPVIRSRWAEPGTTRQVARSGCIDRGMTSAV